MSVSTDEPVPADIYDVGDTESVRAAARASAEDVRLVERLLQGDEAAFVLLVDRFHGRLLRLAQVFVPTRSVAEEIVQDTWLGVISGLHAFERRSALKTWIFRILINRAKTRAVKEARMVPFSSIGGRGPESEPAVDPARFQPNGIWADPPRRWEEDSPEALLLRGEAMAVAERAIEDLPPNQRLVLTLRDVEGFDSREVCNVLQITETNQRVLLHRARSKVRGALERYLSGD